ncbi:MAG TPA: NAD(P)/FAD-dependent oxidoreductase [Woeseiaceae bacterium]|nr:NAD(P)/FAD-dependent oxidoreductase [Woeseiaceae bacterium]
MTCKITRRDFLNGTQVAIGSSLFTPWAEVFGSDPTSKQATDRYYPPALTGLRGNHDGSWETMHARVAGQAWRAPPAEDDFDLVIAGAGISGLSCAWFYRKAHPDARILLLDNHDDFGGHAKRNEFSVNGKTRIAYGGTESIDTPSAYTEVARQLLAGIGVDLQRFYEYYDQDLYASMKLSKAVVFDQKTYGRQAVAVGYGDIPWKDFAARTPMSDRAKADLVRIFTEQRDYLPGMSRDEKARLLSNISYYEFLKDYARMDQQVLEMYRRWGISFWCVGIEEIPAIQVQGYDDGGGMPGLAYTMPRVGHRGDEPYIFHFPDGNASVARLLVRALLPDALPGSSMEDVVTAKLDYTQLDKPGAATRIRLNSTVVNAAHTANEKRVEVTYVTHGTAHAVRAKHCIMACYNSAIPYLCPELSEAQVEGLQYNVKIPLVYTKVMAKNWRALSELGASFVYYTNDYYKQVELDYPVSMGDYKFGASPDDPMALHMCHVPYFEDIRGPEQWRAGRQQLLTTAFKTYEEHVYAQLDAALGNTGFDVERDIAGITVNRWSHGYAYNPGLLWEPDWPSEADKPWVIGRQTFGRIAIANSDAGASADTNTAISQAHRAVADLPG